MIRKHENPNLTVSGLRTKFHPKSRIGQAFVSIGPWIDILLLLGFFYVVNDKLLLQAGVRVQLPQSAFHTGSASDMIAVILSIPGRTSQARREEIVFFDDERFVVTNDRQMAQLKEALERRRKERPDMDLIIQSDERVQHGTVMRVLEMAVDVGIRRANLATRPEH